MEKMRVLLVDDEEDFVETLADRLKLRDVSSEIALNGEQALQILEDQLPDVMLLDLRMPGIDGLEVLRQVKRAYPKVQVIILTARGSDQDEREARRLGAFEYLKKPVDIDVLVKTLRSAYKKIEDTMIAATFAEAGDFKTAKEVMKEGKEKQQGPGRDKSYENEGSSGR